MANNYDINYNDDRFTDVEADKKVALNEVEKTYGDMIAQTDKHYQDQINATNDWEKKQTQLQNDQLNQTLKEINQEKEWAEKDYIKEQSGAYVDWQKQSNPYGANAEQMASAGLAGTGFSESSQVSMYNTYQNRVATAREAFTRIVADFTNQMAQARLQNSSILAEIAFESQQKRLELALQGFQYKNTLLIEQANKKSEVEDRYYARYQDVLQQINHENALAEQVRQYNESMAMEKAKLAEEQRQFNETMAFNKAKAFSSGSGGGGGTKGSGGTKGGGKVKGGSKTSSGSGKSTVNKGSTGKYNRVNLSDGEGTKTGGEKPINAKSVLKAAGGPVSGAELARLEEEGKVTAVEKNGTIYFQKSTPKVKTSFTDQMNLRIKSKFSK